MLNTPAGVSRFYSIFCRHAPREIFSADIQAAHAPHDAGRYKWRSRRSSPKTSCALRAAMRSSRRRRAAPPIWAATACLHAPASRPRDYFRPHFYFTPPEPGQASCFSMRLATRDELAHATHIDWPFLPAAFYSLRQLLTLFVKRRRHLATLLPQEEDFHDGWHC